MVNKRLGERIKKLEERIKTAKLKSTKSAYNVKKAEKAYNEAEKKKNFFDKARNRVLDTYINKHISSSTTDIVLTMHKGSLEDYIEILLIDNDTFESIRTLARKAIKENCNYISNLKYGQDKDNDAYGIGLKPKKKKQTSPLVLKYKTLNEEYNKSQKIWCEKRRLLENKYTSHLDKNSNYHKLLSKKSKIKELQKEKRKKKLTKKKKKKKIKGVHCAPIGVRRPEPFPAEYFS